MDGTGKVVARHHGPRPPPIEPICEVGWVAGGIVTVCDCECEEYEMGVAVSGCAEKYEDVCVAGAVSVTEVAGCGGNVEECEMGVAVAGCVDEYA